MVSLGRSSKYPLAAWIVLSFGLASMMITSNCLYDCFLRSSSSLGTVSCSLSVGMMMLILVDPFFDYNGRVFGSIYANVCWAG